MAPHMYGRRRHGGDDGGDGCAAHCEGGLESKLGKGAAGSGAQIYRVGGDLVAGEVVSGIVNGAYGY